MAGSIDGNQHVREEWRALGFYYEIADEVPCWRLVGSRSGLLRLVDLLDAYVEDLRNAEPPAHDHFGPYWYLKVATHEPAGIDDRGICGSVEDLGRLRDLVAKELEDAEPGADCEIASEYSEAVTHPLRFEVRDPNFDPASEDRRVTPPDLTEAEDRYLADLGALPTSILSRLPTWIVEIGLSSGLFFWGYFGGHRRLTLLGFISLLYFALWRIFGQLRGRRMLQSIYEKSLSKAKRRPEDADA